MDNLYRMWGERNESTNSNTTAVYPAGEEADWMKQLMSATNLETLRMELTNVVSTVSLTLSFAVQTNESQLCLQNLETVMSILHSIWSLLVMNISLLTTVVLSIVWFVLGFGLDLLNFFIEAIVFLTVVYYLLASSDDEWLPLKWVNEMIPSLSQMSNMRKSDRESIGQAVQNAISGVFVLSVCDDFRVKLSSLWILSLGKNEHILCPLHLLHPLIVRPSHRLCPQQ